MPGLQTRPFAHYSGTRGPGALASARWPGVANQQGFAGHFDCCAGAASCVAANFTAVDQPANRSVVMGQVDLRGKDLIERDK